MSSRRGRQGNEFVNYIALVMSAACDINIAPLQLHVQGTPLCHAVVLKGIMEFMNVCLLL